MPTRKPTYPPSLTRYSERSYLSKVLEADPDFQKDANYTPEYEVSSNDGTGKPRVLSGWYKNRGAYSS